MTAIEPVALAIAYRRAGYDFLEMRNGAWLVDPDTELATAAISAHIADIAEHGPSVEMREALAEHGLVIVPREPTDAMYKIVYAPLSGDRGYRNLSQNEFGAIWKAGIDTALEGGG